MILDFPDRLLPGLPYPLGATCDGEGVNFTLFSAFAEKVELCVFDPATQRELARLTLPECTDEVWHGYLPGAGAGLLYGYRVHGPHDPLRGQRFNANKLLLDPYARRLSGPLPWSPEIYGYRVDPSAAQGDDPSADSAAAAAMNAMSQATGPMPLATRPATDLSFDERDSAAAMPKAVVTVDGFDWGDDRLPKVPWPKTVIYEAHLKGLSMLREDLPQARRGTFAGLATPEFIAHLRELGVTTLELLPVQAFLQDWFLLKRGLGNYWGYNTMAFFAPQPEYLVDGDPDEVRLAVKRLHEAGIEVILDVVYNHTAETDELGPTISMRGIDNASYYRLVGVAPGARDGMRAGAAARPAGDGDHGHDGNRGADDGAHAGRYYVNDTGCGNTLNISHPRVLQLVLDSLRYWAESFHIDGFRFDLGTTLGREAHGFDAGAGFFDAIMQDPVLSRLKLVSEPWDLGPDGYQLGRHPPGWAEWNDRYRDSVRRFWRGDAGMRADLAGRLAGSAELFDHRHRKPWASVNYVACHDGATLDDVLRYRGKHNEANGEGNRDGASENYNANLSAEEAAAGAHVHADTGISADTSADTDSETGSSAGANADAIVDARVERLRRAMLATVMLSQGTPMLLGGDEFGRTQRGNNNAYCQDNAISWIDWRLAATPAGRTTTAFVGRLAALRRDFPVLQASRFLHGERLVAPGLADIAWFDERGAALDAAAWQDDQAKVFALRLAGPASSGGAQCVLLCFNAWREPIEFTLPASNPPWRLLLDSAAPDAPAPGDATARTTSSIEVKGHSIMVFATRPANQEHVA